MRTIEENRLIDAANALADLVEKIIKENKVHKTALVLALNNFRMAQIHADDKLQQELEEMLEEYESELGQEINGKSSRKK